jgi:glycosyltransferase involved in cell wall biosynthesis
MLLAGSPRIAYYYSRPDTSTFRYRVFNMVEALKMAAPEASATWFTSEDGWRAVDAVSIADVLVVSRAPYTAHVASIINRAHATGTRVFFDVDDLVFDPRYAHLIMEVLDQPLDEPGLEYWFAYLARLGETLRLCDAAITTNDLLGARLRDLRDVPVFVIPNFLNRAQLDISRHVLDSKRRSNYARNDRVHLGYFSGTPSHNRDFQIIEQSLANIMDDEPSVALRIVGFLDPGPMLARHRARIEVLPLQDFVNLQRVIGETEINLVPLQDNAFTNCKSDLKYFEAAIVGTVTIASPTNLFRNSIRHGENGFLATSQEWATVLRQVIQNIDAVDEVVENAAEDAIARYSPASQAHALCEAFLN